MKKSPRTLNLRQRLLLLLLMAAVPGMGVAVWLTADALEAESRQIETGVARLAALQSAQLNNVIENARVMLETLVQTEALNDLDGSGCGTFMRDWLERFPSFTSLTLLNAEGGPVCSNFRSEMPYDLDRGDWFERVKSERTFVVGRYTVGRSGIPLILAAYPVLDAPTGLVGALVVGIDLRWFDFLARTIELPPKSTVTALGMDGEVLTQLLVRSPESTIGAEVATERSRPSDDARQTMMAAGGAGTLAAETVSGEPRVYGFHRTDYGGLVVAVGMPRFLDFERIGIAMFNSLAAPLSILILALLAAAWGSEAFIMRWVRRLTDRTRRMAAGERGVRSGVPHSRYEIGELAAAFDRMADSIEEREAELENGVKQREVLLDEMNHRVKNDMQVVISLVRLEASRIDAQNAKQRIDDLVGRIRTLAEIHTLLYQTFEGQRAVVTNYAAELCKLLWRFRAGTDYQVELETDIEPVPLSMQRAIPFGLILNELISNAYKHAFHDGEGGRIWVDLHVAPDGQEQPHVTLTVADDGSGPVQDLDIGQSASTGLTLIRALAGQLNGKLDIRREDGRTVFEVTFPLEPARG